MKYFMVFMFFVLVVSNSFAAFEIKDPSNLLSTVDTYVNSGSFDSAYIVGDKVWYKHNECTYNRDADGEFSVSCKDPVIVEDEITNVTVSYAKTSSGRIIYKNKFEDFSGNHLRYYFDSFASDNSLNSVKVEMEKLTFEDVMISGKSVKGIRVFFKIKVCNGNLNEQNECYYLPQEMLLGRNMPMFGQSLGFIFHREAPGHIKASELQNFERL